MLILPNVKVYETLIREPLEDEGSPKQAEAEAVLTALIAALQTLEDDTFGFLNGVKNGETANQDRKLEERVGLLVAARVLQMHRPSLVKALIEA